jgi:hypothetical protein
MQKDVNWEKLGVYVAVMISFLTCIIYIADIKERVAKLEVKIERLEEKR